MNRKMLEGKESFRKPEKLTYDQVKNILSNGNLIGDHEVEVKPLSKSTIQELSENIPINQLSEISKNVIDSNDDEIPLHYGEWFYYQWRNAVIQVLPESDFWKLRTVRNRYKINLEEQQLLQSKVVSIVGLSAGNAVLQVLSMEGVGGTFNIFDFDDFELSNSNRLSYSLFDIGLPKIFLSAREVWERNPYIEINIYSEGFNDQPEHHQAIMQSDLIIDECDSFKIKILLRNLAKQYSKPLLMHTSERGITDIERHDVQSISIFNGLLEGVDLNNPNEVLTSIINPSIVSSRMLQSFGEIGKSIKSWPQLASEVVAGGANITTVSRWILMGEQINSGRYFLNCDSVRD